jgi:LuxR family maltose regulon positive regulatory protein
MSAGARILIDRPQTDSSRGRRPSALGVLESKLSPHPPRPGIVPRTELVTRLTESRNTPFVTISAGPGYGKTTLLAQWADYDSRPFAWVSVDDGDNDPTVLLTYIAVALDRISPIDDEVFDSLSSPGGGAPRPVPMLASAVAKIRRPFVLALDDSDAITNDACIDLVTIIGDHIPHGSQLVLCGRYDRSPDTPRLRALGAALEVGPDELKLGRKGAAQLLRGAGVVLSENEVDDLASRTEGWPAALYLAALSVRVQGSAGHPGGFTGGDPLVADYLHDELLARLPEDEVAFLMRTSVLDVMSGELCDAVAGTSGSAQALESMARNNLFVIALDRRRRLYRYHHLFRELLRSEMERREPLLMLELNARAAAWYEANGQPEAAIPYAQAAGDVDKVAALIARCAVSAYQQGRATTLDRWFTWLDQNSAIEKYPPAATVAAWLFAISGNAAESERWATAAQNGVHEGPMPDGSISIEPWLAMLRVLQCRGGVKQMHADAAMALQGVGAGSPWRPTVIMLLGFSLLLSGRIDEADGTFSDSTEQAVRLDAPYAAIVSLAERALLATKRGSWLEGQILVARSIEVAHLNHLESGAPTTIAFAVSARIAQHLGDTLAARESLIMAQRSRPQLNHSLSFFAIHAFLELARAHVALADTVGARTILRELDHVLLRRPDLGPLFEQQIRAVRAQLMEFQGANVGASALTAAEIRLLPFLPTHLSFREIGERLHVSPHTVKSQAVSAYRKLGVTSRSQAIERAEEIGLL